MSGDVVILFVSGVNDNDVSIYAYVAVMAQRVAAFMAARDSGDFRPDEFGVVLASGEGEPPDGVREKIAAEWGFDPNSMPSVSDADQVQAEYDAHIKPLMTKPIPTA